MYKISSFILASMLCITSLLSQSPILSDELQSNIQSRLEAGDITGIIIGTTNKEEVNYYSKGVRSMAEKAAIEENTLFEIGSISKTFTGLLLADMLVKGKVKLDDDIQKYLPEGINAPTHNGQSIKLVHLANHTSGLPSMPSNFNPANPLNPFEDYSEEKMYQFLNDYELKRNIGSTYEYSNLAVGLLGHLLAAINETSYEALLTTTISEPLDMKSTSITSPKGVFAKGHMGAIEVPNWDFGALQGAGAIRSNAADMMHYLQANMGLTKSKIYPAMQLAQQNSRAADSNPIVGLGWHTMMYNNQEIIWHNGATGGYTSFIGWIKGTDKGVVVLNNSTENVDDIGLHTLVSSFPLKAIRKTIDLDDATLMSYVGKYALAPTFILTVTKENKQLHVQATGQSALPIYPETETNFFYKLVDAQLVFSKDENGKVESVTLFQGGQEMVGKRVE